ncbi:MAG: ABC transporter ATP-binding protein [Chloroflexi bacterium]|nr:ABC transporter ATP-binding protein [Chloroflexota bacterium]
MTEQSTSLDQETPHITLRDLSKTYHEGDQVRAVLDGVNATFQQGEIIALLGPSGSGKSTLLNLISGIDTPTSGEVIVDSINLTSLSERQRTLYRRSNIGYVFQFFNLVPTLTVLENLLLPLELNGISGDDALDRAMTLLKEVGLDARADSFPDRLSGGEQQRVALGRALVHDPALILADEPTGNLDSATGRQVISLLESMARQRGKTVLMATHVSEAANIADRVFTIRDGRLLEQAPAASA